ncbi:MAG: DUF4956 domain-containing protein [bacterium]
MTDYFNFTLAEFSSAVIVLNILLSFALSLIITWVYKKTHRSLSYSQSLLFTMVIICVLGSVVMMVVRNNIVGAFALLGAFSLIRFRTVIKETKDVAYIFFSLTTGVAVGTNNYMVAVLTTIILCLIILLLTKYNFGSLAKHGALVTFIASGSFPAGGYKGLFNDYLAAYDLLQIKSLEDGSSEYSFSVKIRDDKMTDKFVKEFRSLSGVENIELINSKSAAEY